LYEEAVAECGEESTPEKVIPALTRKVFDWVAAHRKR
jgi:hypothetical protein